jgi:hypothetical protein
MKIYKLAILLLFVCGCVYKNVDTFEKYCDHINHRNETQAYGWDKEKIKDDFVKYYNQVVLSYIADYNLAGAKYNDSAVQFLYRSDLAGVKQKGDELIIMNCFLYNDDDPIIKEFKVPEDDTFKGFTERFKYLLYNRIKKENELTEPQRCIFAAIGAFYKKIIITGAKDDRMEIINEDFDMFK